MTKLPWIPNQKQRALSAFKGETIEELDGWLNRALPYLVSSYNKESRSRMLPLEEAGFCFTVRKAALELLDEGQPIDSVTVLRRVLSLVNQRRGLA